MFFAVALKQARKDLGIRQKEVAADTGITPSNLSKYEKGLRVPPLENALKLSKYLGLSLDELREHVKLPGEA